MPDSKKKKKKTDISRGDRADLAFYNKYGRPAGFGDAKEIYNIKSELPRKKGQTMIGEELDLQEYNMGGPQNHPAALTFSNIWRKLVGKK